MPINHFHMLSGTHGHMPDQNNLHSSRTEAVDDLIGFVALCQDDPDVAPGFGPIIVADNREYAEFPLGDCVGPVYGVEYAQVTECAIEECIPLIIYTCSYCGRTGNQGASCSECKRDFDYAETQEMGVAK